MKITSKSADPDFKEQLTDALIYVDISMGLDDDDIPDHGGLPELVQEASDSLCFLVDLVNQLTTENEDAEKYLESLEAQNELLAIKQLSYQRCDYDEDLDEATNVLVEAMCGADLFEPTANGEITCRKLTITPEDLKSCLRQSIITWASRRTN